ncbi:MAG TPA: hypothetical protein VFW66_09920 [Gemmatimonadales bacterium]|nr:hypothetical protein [Gemmatimonadales bacterium]
MTPDARLTADHAAALPEAARDRALRRLDWRFLRPGARCESPALVDPSPVALRERRAQLAPGEICFAEWHRPVLGGAGAIQAQLAAAGFDDVALYWPWPRLARPWFWLPLGSEAAIAYVRASRVPSRWGLRRGIDGPLQRAWARAARRGWLWPLAAVARAPRADVPAAAPDSPELLARLQRDWEKWNLGPAPGSITWMLLTRGPRSISKVVGLAFAEPDSVPRVAVKFARVPEAAEGLRREAAALAAVHARRAGGMPGAPRILCEDPALGHGALAETALAGQPLYSLLTPATHRDLAVRAADWLAELASPAAAPASAAPASAAPRAGAAPMVERAVRDFVTQFGPVLERSERDEAERVITVLHSVPSVIEQRDFSPWNVHVAPDGSLAVFDWESAELEGLPLLDLVYFLAYVAFFRDGAVVPGGRAPRRLGRCRESYRQSLDPKSATGAVAAACVDRYVSRVPLDPSLIRGLRRLTWLVHARSDYRHAVADAGGRAPGSRTLRRSLFLALWREELSA